MSLGRFALIVAAAVLGSLGLVLPALPLDASARWAALLGAALAGLNALAAYALVVWASGRSNVAFFRAVLGGMLGRMAFLLLAVLLAVLVLGVPRLPLVISLLAYFVLLLAFELAVVHRRTEAQQ